MPKTYLDLSDCSSSMASCILWRRCPPCGRWSCCWDEIGKNPGLADTSPKATMRQTRIRFDEAIGMRCGLTGWSVDPFCKILFEFCRKTGSSTCGDIAFYLVSSHAPHLPLSLSFFLSLNHSHSLFNYLSLFLSLSPNLSLSLILCSHRISFSHCQAVSP